MSFKLQQEVLKCSDIFMSLGTDLVTNFLNVENQRFVNVSFS